MYAAKTGANAVPNHNNQRIDFTLPVLMERLQWVKSSGLKQAEFSSRSEKNKHVTMYASGRMVFYTRARYNGQRPRIELGEINTHTLDQIHQNYLDVRKKIADGHDPGQLQCREMTYADFFDQIYLPDRKNRNKRSLTADVSRDQHWLRPRFGDIRLTAIHNRMAHELVTDMKAKKLATSTIRNVISLLKSVLQLAVDMDMLAHHPIKYRPPAPDAPKHRDYPTLEELSRFVGAAWRCTDTEYSTGRMWALTMLTACRTGEVLDAKKSDFELNPEGVPIRWRLSRQKSGKLGTIELKSPAIQQLVGEMIAASNTEYLVPGLRGNAQASRPIKLFKRLCERAGIDSHWTPHMLRHGFATVAKREAALPEAVIADILRHSSPEVTRRIYIHADGREQAAAANDAVVSLILSQMPVVEAA